ncbi:DUF4245 domain-containing protein [Streptomyces sp. DSM 44915]|uniref:DUF4245 domain-containing protein n=1 Tax=Streptomyces chisholmiae TaxID=3075540 RepID=A0ABU2JK96_9ACTN|nr:DUF4245 domain-containing protein [Streptomyces sp. DSM 44915]MDT0265411.1 DUF4245 domain-containing protein [Streptomyces sp. DSM 44915]
MANEEVTEVAPEAGERAAGPEPAQQDGGDRRLKRLRRQSFQNMVLSLGLICLGTFAVYFVMPSNSEEQQPTRAVEYEVASATAARAAPYPLVVPQGLPADWRATSVRFEPGGEYGVTWRLGFIDAEDEYAALAQADGDPADFVPSVTQRAEDTGETERIAGRDWARWEGPKYDALVLTEAEVTTVVMGTAPLGQLVVLAESLEVRETTQPAP